MARKSRSSRSSSSSRSRTVSASRHLAFWPLVAVTLLLWVFYRSLFHFPVWFDESVGKAIFFALPVWLYMSLSGAREIRDTFDLSRLNKGLLLGLALGGVFGFAGSLGLILAGGKQVYAAPLFMLPAFWWEFFLALLTGFWESLFFFGWIMSVILIKCKKWPLLNILLLNAAVFSIFHLPYSLLNFSGMILAAQVFLLFIFAIGQGLIFYRWRNIYALALIQAIWGMVLLVYGG
jgi:hypothetical protein